MCSFCKYAEWQGDCGEQWAECKHPLADKLDSDGIIESVQLGEGTDCWAFRPKVDIPTADGMVQNWLLGKDAVLPKDVVWKGSEHDGL